MATVIYIKESKQTPSAMRDASTIARRRRNPLTRTGGSMWAASTASVNTLMKNSWQPKIFTAKHRVSIFISTCNPLHRVKFRPTTKRTASVWSLPRTLFQVMRCWCQRVWMHTTTSAFRACTTILLSIRSVLRMAERSTSRRTPCRSLGTSAIQSVRRTGCRSFLPPSELTGHTRATKMPTTHCRT